MKELLENSLQHVVFADHIDITQHDGSVRHASYGEFVSPIESKKNEYYKYLMTNSFKFDVTKVDKTSENGDLDVHVSLALSYPFSSINDRAINMFMAGKSKEEITAYIDNKLKTLLTKAPTVARTDNFIFKAHLIENTLDIKNLNTFIDYYMVDEIISISMLYDFALYEEAMDAGW